MPQPVPPRRQVLAAGVASVLVAAACMKPAAAAEGGVRVVLQQALPNMPGKTMTAVLVSYGPGQKSPPHRHAASADIVAFVVSGAIRSQVEGGKLAVYKAGEAWFEPPGAHHLVSENASTTEPASLLAVFVADTGATLTTFDK